MRNIRLTIQYDGTNYQGWQRQSNGPSIQETVENAILIMTGEKRALLGSGRTDAGVHALAQQANFYTDCSIPVEKFAKVLNCALPEDIFISKAEEVDLSFHAIREAIDKTYCYTIYGGKQKNVFLDRYAWHIPYDLDLDRMKSASKLLLGEHDFFVFSKQGKVELKTTVRNMQEIQITQDGGQTRFTYRADGFLYNMVRILTGALVRIGAGKEDESAITEMFLKTRTKKIGITAPAKGLSLIHVTYEK